jgi:hypothetical protein
MITCRKNSLRAGQRRRADNFSRKCVGERLAIGFRKP